MGSSYRFNVSETVRARFIENEDEFRICIVMSCYFLNDQRCYEIIDNWGDRFDVIEDSNFIRKFVEKPVDHIKQSIEFGDNYDDISRLIEEYGLDITIIYRDILKSAFTWGNVNVIECINEIIPIQEYLREKVGNQEFDNHGRQLIHLAALNRDNRLLFELTDNDADNRFRGFHFWYIIKARDGKGKSLLHYLVAANNLEYITIFHQQDLVEKFDIYEEQNSLPISIYEWKDNSGKDPIDMAKALKRTEFLPILEEGKRQSRISSLIKYIRYIMKMSISTRDTYLKNALERFQDLQENKGGGISDWNKYCLHMLACEAAREGLADVLEVLLRIFPKFFEQECLVQFEFNQELVDSYFRHFHVRVNYSCISGDSSFNRQLLAKLELPNNLLTAVVLGSLKNNMDILLCDFDAYDHSDEQEQDNVVEADENIEEEAIDDDTDSNAHGSVSDEITSNTKRKRQRETDDDIDSSVYDKVLHASEDDDLNRKRAGEADNDDTISKRQKQEVSDTERDTDDDNEDEDEDDPDGFDYFKAGLDKVFQKWSQFQKLESLFGTKSSHHSYVEYPEIFTTLIESSYIDSDYYSTPCYYLRWQLNLIKKYECLGDIYGYCKGNQIMGLNVEERKSTLRLLLQFGYSKLQFPLALYVEVCQVKVILRGSTFDTDVFDLNLKVDSGDLTCLDTDRNKKAYMRSGLKRSELLHLTKGQFLLVYSILINEIGSFMSLFDCSEIEEKVFSFGTYTSILHFSVALGRIAVTKVLLRQGYKIIGCLVDHHYSHLNKTALTEIAVECNSFHIFKAIQRHDDLSRVSPERILELSSSRSLEFRDWQATINKKYQFCEILRLLDDNELSQNQFIRYFNYIGLTEYVSDRCFSIKSWERNYSQLYEDIKYTLSIIENSDIKVDDYEYDHEACRQTIYDAWKRRDLQQLYFSTKVSEHDWLQFLRDTELDQIVACIFVKVIFKQWSQLLSHCIGLLTLNSDCDDDIMFASDANDSSNFLNELLPLIDSRSVDLHTSSLIVKSVIESTNQEQIMMKEKDEVSSLLLELNETCSQFVDMFMSVAPVSQLEQNIRTQKGCLEKLEQLAKLDKKLEKSLKIINGKFTENYDSFYFRYKKEEKEDGSVHIRPFEYAIEKASLPLLQLLFDKVCVNEFRMFQTLIEHAAYCLQFDILQYLQSTLLAYTERGTISLSTDSIVTGYYYGTTRPLQQIDCDDCAVNAIREKVLARWFRQDRFAKWREGDGDNEFLLVANKAIEFGAVKKVNAYITTILITIISI